MGKRVPVSVIKGHPILRRPPFQGFLVSAGTSGMLDIRYLPSLHLRTFRDQMWDVPSFKYVIDPCQLHPIIVRFRSSGEAVRLGPQFFGKLTKRKPCLSFFPSKSTNIILRGLLSMMIEFSSRRSPWTDPSLWKTLTSSRTFSFRATSAMFSQ